MKNHRFRKNNSLQRLQSSNTKKYIKIKNARHKVLLCEVAMRRIDRDTKLRDGSEGLSYGVSVFCSKERYVVVAILGIFK